MTHYAKVAALLTVLVFAAGGLQGCNTVRGAGKDIQKGGEAVEDAASNVEVRRSQAHTIQASAAPGGSIQPSGTMRPAAGTDWTYTITPDTGYRVADVLVDGASIGPVRAHTFDRVNSNHTIEVSFALDSRR